MTNLLPPFARSLAIDNPVYGYDVYVQRVSCYIQHKQTINEQPPTANGDGFNKKETKRPKESFDNGNSIVIFDNSQSGSIEDTLVAARQLWECRWRRLPFFLAFESRDLVSNDEQLAFQCSRVILGDIFKVLSETWDGFLNLAMDHVSILEDKVYEQPADETKAPELWTNSSTWLKVEKLIYVHIDAVKDMRAQLQELTGRFCHWS